MDERWHRVYYIAFISFWCFFFFLIVTWQLLQTSSQRGVLISRFPARTHRTRNAGCPSGTGRATSPAGADTVEQAVWQRPGAGGTALLCNCRKRSARPLRVLALGDCSPAEDGRELRLQAPRGCGLTLTQPPPGTGQPLGASPSHIKTGTFVPVRRSSKRGRRAAEPGQARRGLLRARSPGWREQRSRGPATSQRSLPPGPRPRVAPPRPRVAPPRPAVIGCQLCPPASPAPSLNLTFASLSPTGRRALSITRLGAHGASCPPESLCRGGKGRALGAAAVSPPPRGAAPAGPASEPRARGGAGRVGSGSSARRWRAERRACVPLPWAPRYVAVPSRLSERRRLQRSQPPLGPRPWAGSLLLSLAAAGLVGPRSPLRARRRPGRAAGPGSGSRRPCVAVPRAGVGRRRGSAGARRARTLLRQRSRVAKAVAVRPPSALSCRRCLRPWGSLCGGRCRCCWRWLFRASARLGL